MTRTAWPHSARHLRPFGHTVALPVLRLPQCGEAGRAACTVERHVWRRQGKAIDDVALAAAWRDCRGGTSDSRNPMPLQLPQARPGWGHLQLRARTPAPSASASAASWSGRGCRRRRAPAIRPWEYNGKDKHNKANTTCMQLLHPVELSSSFYGKRCWALDTFQRCICPSSTSRVCAQLLPLPCVSCSPAYSATASMASKIQTAAVWPLWLLLAAAWVLILASVGSWACRLHQPASVALSAAAARIPVTASHPSTSPACRGVAALQQNCHSSNANSPLFGAGTVAYLSPGERGERRRAALRIAAGRGRAYCYGMLSKPAPSARLQCPAASFSDSHGEIGARLCTRSLVCACAAPLPALPVVLDAWQSPPLHP